MTGCDGREAALVSKVAPTVTTLAARKGKDLVCGKPLVGVIGAVEGAGV